MPSNVPVNNLWVTMARCWQTQVKYLQQTQAQCLENYFLSIIDKPILDYLMLGNVSQTIAMKAKLKSWRSKGRCSTVEQAYCAMNRSKTCCPFWFPATLPWVWSCFLGCAKACRFPEDLLQVQCVLLGANSPVLVSSAEMLSYWPQSPEGSALENSTLEARTLAGCGNLEGCGDLEVAIWKGSA